MLRLLPALLLLLAACGDRAATLDDAKALVATAQPERAAISRLVRTSDPGDRWQPIYTRDSTAGTSIFEVDKRNGRVVPTRLEQ